RPDDPGHPRARPGHAGAAQPLRQEGNPQRRRPEGPQGARTGHGDRGRHVPRLRRADRAHALWQRLYVAADGRGRLRRELGERLPHQQALRGGAGPLDLRARGEQRDPLGERQAVAKPQRRAEEMGARRRPRREHDGARQGLRAREPGARQGEEHRDQGGGHRQVRVPEDRRPVPGQAREGAGPARRQDQGPHPVHRLTSNLPGAGKPVGISARLVLGRQRHLKWRLLDGVELGLMVACGLTLFGFCVTVCLDIVTRTIGHPWLWLQEVTSTLFVYGIFFGFAAATRRNDHLYLTAFAESMHGRSRLIAELAIRLIVLTIAICMVYYGYLNFLRGFGSFRLPSNTPIASLYAAIPISGALILLFTIEQIVNGCRNGFDHPEFDDPAESAAFGAGRPDESR